MNKIHYSAIINVDSTDIGDCNYIWHFTHVMNVAKIGDGNSIGQNCFIAGEIGDDCKIQNNVSVYEGVVIGNNVFVGPSVVFTNVKRPRAWFKSEYVATIVEDDVTIGANSTIIAGVTLGKGCFIGAGSVVTKDVPPYTQVQGNPAQIVAEVNIDCQFVKIKP